MQQLLIAQIESGKIKAAHDLSEGGLLVCLAEMLFDGNELGASVSISPENLIDRLDAILFGESQGRVIVAVPSSESGEFISSAQSAGVKVDSLGHTNNSGQLIVQVSGQEVLSSSVKELRSKWENAIPDHMEASKR